MVFVKVPPAFIVSSIGVPIPLERLLPVKGLWIGWGKGRADTIDSITGVYGCQTF
jgi:hypothetical protein